MTQVKLSGEKEHSQFDEPKQTLLNTEIGKVPLRAMPLAEAAKTIADQVSSLKDANRLHLLAKFILNRAIPYALRDLEGDAPTEVSPTIGDELDRRFMSVFITAAIAIELNRIMQNVCKILSKMFRTNIRAEITVYQSSQMVFTNHGKSDVKVDAKADAKADQAKKGKK